MSKYRSLLLAPCAAFVCQSAALGASLSATGLTPNDLVVTEYLANPTGVADAGGEYFEIYNASGTTVDADGLIVRDDGNNSFTVSGLVIPADTFAVFSASDGTALGITPDYIYGSAMALTNGADEIGLYRPDDTLISKVAYDDGDAFGAGVAHELALLNPTTPTLMFGPSAGTDFIGAVAALALGNIGSPGVAGQTQIGAATVPLPASFWLFGTALTLLARARRRLSRRIVRHRQPGRGGIQVGQPRRSLEAAAPCGPAEILSV